MAEPFQLLKKSQQKHIYALLIVYALGLFVYILLLRSVLSSEWVGIWYLGSLFQALCTFPGGSGSQYRSWFSLTNISVFVHYLMTCHLYTYGGLANSSWSTGNFALKFAVPLSATILHMLKKNQLGGHFESVINDVRVTSCSADLDQQ